MPKIILKPCPFCGNSGEPFVRMLPQHAEPFGLYYKVVCDCGTEKTCFTKFKTQMAVEWNNRRMVK